jgi:hypothetical protein
MKVLACPGSLSSTGHQQSCIRCSGSGPRRAEMITKNLVKKFHLFAFKLLDVFWRTESFFCIIKVLACPGSLSSTGYQQKFHLPLVSDLDPDPGGPNLPIKNLVKKFNFFISGCFFGGLKASLVSWKSWYVLAHCPPEVTPTKVPSGVSESGSGSRRAKIDPTENLVVVK